MKKNADTEFTCCICRSSIPNLHNFKEHNLNILFRFDTGYVFTFFYITTPIIDGVDGFSKYYYSSPISL